MTASAQFPAELEISTEDIEGRRRAAEPTERVIFRVAGLYGLSRESVPFPVSQTESIDSGPVSVTLDPENTTSNIGMIDYARCYLRVSYGVHAVFPGMHELVMSGKHDLSLLGPVRAVATDECQVTPEMTGWRALGCLDFLPGSLWAGASGG
ncbi:MAG: hypothetical protein LBI49_20395 [Nocardiopsaceae bacterium]|jgi:hypothetical protein|nr:hypothetical protein [Nocardiopsaceae bacterium]